MSTIKVSRSTLEELEALREALKAKSVEEVIRRFLMERRQRMLEEVFGIDKGRIKPFTEEDRGEDRG
ncbi:MAG: ribbon-helix-helix protein, CopG family [Thermoproteota archaeon]|nr:ribbon-helix-helix protein, CopG family [Candidatus Brockarchaeota archaeon]